MEDTFDRMCNAFQARVDELTSITRLRLEGDFNLRYFGSSVTGSEGVSSLKNVLSCRLFAGTVFNRAERHGGRHLVMGAKLRSSKCQ